MKRAVIIVFLFVTLQSIVAQTILTIEESQVMARENYPAIQRYGLIKKTEEYNLSNAEKGYLPQFSINGQASYQSDVTKIPIAIEGVEALPKDQYKATVDLSQTIWDGGLIRSQKQITRAGAEVERQQLEVELYTVEERVNQLFFGILLFDAQLEQNHIMQDDLRRNYKMIESYKENGIANQADLDAVRVEILRMEQQVTEIKANRKAYLQMLSAMIGVPLDEHTILVKPEVEDPILITSVNRPELELYRAQYDLYEIQKKQITTSYLPKFSFFVQGGYGRPGLNMLDRDFAFFYIGGVRLNWNLGGLYTQKNERRKLEINQYEVAVQQETFLYNTNLQIVQESSDIRKMKELIAYDNEIITLRGNVKRSAETKVANGTLTAVDLMREVNAENSAWMDKVSHEIQLLMSVYKLKNTTNN